MPGFGVDKRLGEVSVAFYVAIKSPAAVDPPQLPQETKIKMFSLFQPESSRAPVWLFLHVPCFGVALGACTHLPQHSHNLFLPDKNLSSLLEKNPSGDPGANLGFVRPCESALKL